MVRAKIYKLFFVFCTVLVILFYLALVGVFAQPTIKNDVVIKPAIVDLGAIEDEQYTTEINVRNTGGKCSLSSKIEGKGSDSITVFPNTFTLSKGENKNIKIKINLKSLKIGAYDLSILFTTDVSNGNSQEMVSAKGVTSFRIKFSKPGITTASFNVVDVEKPNDAKFHIIYANFLHNKSYVNSIVRIICTENNKIITEFNQKISMNPYPEPGFYGTLEIPFSTKEVEMGKYLVKVDSITTDGIKLYDEKSFKVGVLKGKLVGVSAKNVRKGEKARFKATVKNTGNLNLNCSFKVVIKNNKGEKIFPDRCNLTIPPDSEQTLIIETDTNTMPPGVYTAEYEVKYGNEVSNGSLNFKIHSHSSIIVFVIIGIFAVIVILLIMFIYLKKLNVKKDIQ
jgi:hypothetical protein